VAREVAMQLSISTEDTRLLLSHLDRRLQEMDEELVHTDKRELQRQLGRDVRALRALAERIRASAGFQVGRDTLPDLI
jgi:hypothetical protein